MLQILADVNKHGTHNKVRHITNGMHVYQRYMDDTVDLISFKNNTQRLSQKFNEAHLNLRFILEVEHNNSHF